MISNLFQVYVLAIPLVWVILVLTGVKTTRDKVRDNKEYHVTWFRNDIWWYIVGFPLIGSMAWPMLIALYGGSYIHDLWLTFTEKLLEWLKEKS